MDINEVLSMRQLLQQRAMLQPVRLGMECLDSFAAAQLPRWPYCGVYVVYDLVRLLRGYHPGGMPGIINCRKLISGGEGIGGDTAAFLPGLKLGNPC